jgi:hypothetical protein
VVVHADDQERRARSGVRYHGQPPEPLGTEHRLVDDDRVSRNPAEEPDQLCQVGGRSDRLDARLALQEAAEPRPDPLVASGDEDRDGRSMERSRLHGHEGKDRRDAGSAHPRAGLNRCP